MFPMEPIGLPLGVREVSTVDMPYSWQVSSRVDMGERLLPSITAAFVRIKWKWKSLHVQQKRQLTRTYEMNYVGGLKEAFIHVCVIC